MDQSSQASSLLSTAPSASTSFLDNRQAAKNRVDGYAPKSSDDYTATLLRTLLDHKTVIGLSGFKNLIDDVIKTPDLGLLAEHYMTSIFVPCTMTDSRLRKKIESHFSEPNRFPFSFKARGGTPTALPTPRPGGFDDVDDIAAEIVSQKRDQQRLKKMCLDRDGGRCMVTGFTDHKRFPADERSIRTQAVHIIPFSLGDFGEAQRRSISTSWDAIYRMFPDIRSRINFSANSINETRNVMTMSENLHPTFGEFGFCFIETERPNHYRIEKHQVTWGVGRDLPEYVTFTAHSGFHELPSPELLRIHAAITRVLHASGLAEAIDGMLRERQMLRCFAEDGSTPVSRLFLGVF
ncbi:hypothetical protein FN846DRAFT_891052 [Sphaerosporella brunnea]|uniref:HNH nuclease domain-containing protein n=1 Tax=Sphaerosporella brunnea TaxID=1250544 RepID=A0A5J5EVC2_9PEZI|nr:hypothetical protein FN846DRAFT_891052 [Sphaerosporella brunnea]